MSVWEVVGGVDKGGILVRVGVGTKSEQLTERLSTGALVEEVELQGDRLNYKLLSGTGPAVGWVSTKLTGKDLVVKTDKIPPVEEDARAKAEEEAKAKAEAEAKAKAEEAKAKAEAEANAKAEEEARAKAEAEAEAKAQAEAADAAKAEVAAPTSTAEEVGATPVPSADAGGMDVKAMIKARCDRELAKPPIPWKWIDQDLVFKNHMLKGRGLAYGIEFPWNEETLAEMGPEWLTEAMHTVGSLPEDNRVTKIILEKKIRVTTGNNGGKFLFEVEYEKPSPDLHTKLFAKVPFPLEGALKNDRLSSSINKQPAELYEINAYRMLEASLPMKTPRFYYGDMSNETSNWIIITERIAFHDFEGNNFGAPKKERPKPLPAFEIEGPYDKCIDYNLRGKPEEYYMLLTRVGAKMAGLAKAGNLGPLELLSQSFRWSPDASNPAMWGMNPQGPSGENPKQVKAKLDFACSFISDTGKVLFPRYAQKDPFLKKLTTVMMTVNAYNSELNYWMHQDTDYTALGHMNLNVDNAFFWRDEAGVLDCGVFDWGGMGSSAIGSKLWWWYYCMDFEPFKRQLKKLLAAFCEEYEANGGPKIDPKVMEPHVIIAALQQMSGLVSAVPQILKMCAKKEWATIKDRYDPRIGENVDSKSTIRLYLHCINSIIRIIEEMKGDKLVETWIKETYEGTWKMTPKSPSMIGLE